MTKTIGIRVNNSQEEKIRSLILRRGFGSGENCGGVGSLIRALINEEFARIFEVGNGKPIGVPDTSGSNPLRGGDK